MTEVVILNDIPRVPSWTAILHMEDMLARVTGGELIDVSGAPPGRLASRLHDFTPRARGKQDRVAICVTTGPWGAHKFLPYLRRAPRFSRVALWIIDSFWTDATYRERRTLDRHFDHIAYVQRFDDGVYRSLFRDRALCLEVGSDVLDWGGASDAREFDLQRIGRQPEEWDDDAEVAIACSARGLTYRGRPAMASAGGNFGTLMRDFYSRTKFVLAHSNIAAPATYTHPTKAYLTSRWTDALACGASVAGMPPQGDLDLIDWPDALLPLKSLDRQTGLDLIAEAARTWTPATARRNHLGALRRLDWRWRFRRLVEAMELQLPLLDDEISRLEDRIATVSAD